MERKAIIDHGVVVNVVVAPADWVDASGRETVSAPMGAGIEIGATRQADGSWQLPAPPPMTAEEVRDQRNALLAASDWTQVADAPVDKAAWATYRQALRDVPDQAGFPDAVEWPVAPNHIA